MLFDSSAAHVLISLCVGLFGFGSGGGFNGLNIGQPNLGPVEPQSCGVANQSLVSPCRVRLSLSRALREVSPRRLHRNFYI